MKIYAEIVPPATETATNSTAPRAQSWRDTLPIHPAAELFPLMSPDELAALGEDIRKHGLTSSIVLWSDGKSQALLLDGRSRLDAIEIAIRGPAIVGAPSLIAGKNFLACNKVIVLDRSVDPYAYVTSANIHRRHLTAEHKRELIAKLIEADPTKSNRQIAKTVKVDHKTVASVRAEKEDVGKFPTARPGPTARAGGSSHGRPRRSRPVFPRRCCNSARPPPNAFAVSGAATRSATTSAPGAQVNANGCVHATKNCKPSLRILRSRTLLSAARSKK